jgi:hypothetical protein
MFVKNKFLSKFRKAKYNVNANKIFKKLGVFFDKF